jgi:hypothetical protein
MVPFLRAWQVMKVFIGPEHCLKCRPTWKSNIHATLSELNPMEVYQYIVSPSRVRIGVILDIPTLERVLTVHATGDRVRNNRLDRLLFARGERLKTQSPANLAETESISQLLTAHSHQTPCTVLGLT